MQILREEQKENGIVLMESVADESFNNAMKSNASWADYKQHSSPEYFEKFKAGQTPTIRKLHKDFYPARTLHQRSLHATL